MKLRIHEQSLRFRLKEPEVARLGEGGAVTATLTLPGGSFVYQLQVAPQAPMAIADRPGELTLLLPAEATRAWAASEEEGLYGDVATPAGPLRVQVEKDYECRHRDEPEAGSYPNPRD